MAITIGSNIAALIAQRALTQNSNDLSRTFERLSSGLRINRASDDAAGLAISTRLGADARLYNAAARNINDGFSLINIATGALEQQSGILQRLAELAEQAANGSYSNNQRRSLDLEYQQLVKELGRIGDSTTFNGLNLLQGNRSTGIGSMHIQAGISGSSDARITLTSGDTATLSGTINRDSIRYADLNGLNGIDVPDLFVMIAENSAGHTDESLRAAYRDQVYFTEYTDSSGVVYEVATAFIHGSFFDQTDRIGVQFFTRQRGTTQWAGASGGANIISYQGGTFDIDPTTGAIVGSGLFSATVGTSTMNIDFSGLRFLSQGSSGGNGSAIEFSGVDTITRARSALGIISSRLSEISSIQGQYGAFESRLLSAFHLVSSAYENSLQARSRIMDVDIAAETAEMVRKSILQQAGAAILTQANTQPQLALLLLQ